jgi:hypothetical protein
VLKLIANRPIDQQDVLRLAAHDDIDWDYVAKWCTEWRVADNLAGLRRIMPTL